MKFLSYFTALILSTTLLSCQSSEVPVTVHFENAENAKFDSGTLTVKETGKTYQINSSKDLVITLPKGKYSFAFKSETGFTIVYPNKIKSSNQTVNIILHRSNINLNQQIATAENIEELMKTGDAKFIAFGIAMQDFGDFEKKYGVGLKTEGCVIDAGISKTATENNILLSNYLTTKYGDSWEKDLPFLPYGLETI